MIDEYWKIVIFQIVVFIAVAPIILTSYTLAPRSRNPIKYAPFECGQLPLGEGRSRFAMQYYAYILMFAILDVVAMFLYAWGLAFANVGSLGVLSLVLFIGILLPPLGYALYLSGRRELW